MCAVGGILTTAVGAVALVRLWQVFPFGFGDAVLDWSMVMRVLIVVGVVGSVIAAIGSLVALARPDPIAQ